MQQAGDAHLRLNSDLIKWRNMNVEMNEYQRVAYSITSVTRLMVIFVIISIGILDEITVPGLNLPPLKSDWLIQRDQRQIHHGQRKFRLSAYFCRSPFMGGGGGEVDTRKGMLTSPCIGKTVGRKCKATLYDPPSIMTRCRIIFENLAQCRPD